jgi:hypothetical protein
MAFNRQTQRLGFEDWANAVSDATTLPMDVTRLVTEFLDVGKAVRPVADTRITELMLDQQHARRYGSCGWLLHADRPLHYRDARVEFCVESDTCRTHGRWCGLCSPSRVRCMLYLWQEQRCLAIFADTAYRDIHGATCFRGQTRFYGKRRARSLGDVGEVCITKDACITFGVHQGTIRYRSDPLPQLRHALEAMACHLMSWRACRDINQNIEP